MPLGDGTGPAGMGPMTGRAAGYCAGFNMPGYANAYGGRLGLGFGWGRGRGGGWGRGWGRGRFWGYGPAAGAWGVPYGAYPYAPAYSADQQKQGLETQVQFFENQLASLRKRLDELEAEPPEGKK
ncbi:MAG: DUF5320 domain-containing protein [Spirochaetales bacterium]|nr:DUF5320 domain-containing protein [Spirochaetales bacterium]